MPRLRPGELLIREGPLSDEQLQQAVLRQKQTGHRLGAVLQDRGLVTDKAIARLLATQRRRHCLDAHPDNVNAGKSSQATPIDPSADDPTRNDALARLLEWTEQQRK